MFRVQQFMTLTGLTALEAIRQPLCVLLATSCIIVTGLVPMLLMYQFGEDGRLARDSGLALHFVIGLVVAAYTASSALSREMRDGTAAVTLSKPVGRELFFLAKFAGVSLVIVAYSMAATAATLLSERVAEKSEEARHTVIYVTDWQTGILLCAAPLVAYLLAGYINYRTRRPFQSTAFALVFLSVFVVFLVAGFFNRHGHLSSFDFNVQWRIVPASALVTLALIILSAVALGFSTRLGTAPTLTLSVGVFILGLMSEYWFGPDGSGSPIGLICYRLLPNWQHFWMSDALAGGGAISPVYMLRAGLHGAAYLTGILLLGMVSFRHVEVK